MIGVHEIVEYASYKNYLGKKCPYEGSPFQVYKQMSSKVKGAHFEKIFEEYMIAKGYELRKNYNSDHDRVFVVDGEEVKFEVKGSLLWGEEGTSMKWTTNSYRPRLRHDCVHGYLPYTYPVLLV